MDSRHYGSGPFTATERVVVRQAKGGSGTSVSKEQADPGEEGLSGIWTRVGDEMVEMAIEIGQL